MGKLTLEQLLITAYRLAEARLRRCGEPVFTSAEIMEDIKYLLPPGDKEDGSTPDKPHTGRLCQSLPGT